MELKKDDIVYNEVENDEDSESEMHKERPSKGLKRKEQPRILTAEGWKRRHLKKVKQSKDKSVKK